MGRGFECRKDVMEALKEGYDSIVYRGYSGDYLSAVQHFDLIAEAWLRSSLQSFYADPRSRDQAWRTCKGALYEYAVLKSIQQIVDGDNELRRRFIVIAGSNIPSHYREQLVIRNWSEISPDADILVVERASSLVKAIVSCKTSLRERLTETAFWKRELEKSGSTRNIRLIFVTTDKDDELRIDSNRYIILHVVDCTFITDPQKYDRLIKFYKSKYGNRGDFTQLVSKIKMITEIGEYLRSLD